jgi:hypothetical protein
MGNSTAVPTLEELMAVASEQTGLSDFGVQSYRAGYSRFLQSLAEDAHLPAPALDAVLATLTRRLANRLHIEEWYRTHPEIADVPVDGPVAITGIPRSGTTVLADMMSLDPQFRPLRGWEQSRPCPPPKIDTEATDPRRLEAVANHEVMQRDQPEQMAMHLWEVDSTMEDTDVLGIEGRAQSAVVPVTGYHVWWRENSMRDAYEYHYRVMQLLHSQRPPTRWLFKSPHMSFHLTDFVAAYPGARFVMTHRDPIKAVPSWISFVSSLFPPVTMDTIDMGAFGRHLAEHLAFGASRSIEARRALGESRFFDVHHHHMVADPIGTLEAIYAWLDRPLTAPVRTAMEAWAERNSSGAHGSHRYTLEQFGLEARSLRADFKTYTDHFGVRLES